MKTVIIISRHPSAWYPAPERRDMDENVSLFLVKVRGPYVDRMTFITESDFSFVYS